MSPRPQATLVVEYPCDRFCRIEVDLGGEQSQATLHQLREKADKQHQRLHEPENAQATPAPAAEPEPTGRPAATVFLSAPGRANSAPGRSNERRR